MVSIQVQIKQARERIKNRYKVLSSLRREIRRLESHNLCDGEALDRLTHIQRKGIE